MYAPFSVVVFTSPLSGPSGSATISETHSVSATGTAGASGSATFTPVTVSIVPIFTNEVLGDALVTHSDSFSAVGNTQRLGAASLLASSSLTAVASAVAKTGSASISMGTFIQARKRWTVTPANTPKRPDKSLNITPYIRANRPEIEEGLPTHFDNEFRRVEETLTNVYDAAPQAVDEEPEVKRRGMIRFALPPWNPGDGTARWYWYDGANWYLYPDTAVRHVGQASITAIVTPSAIMSLTLPSTYAYITQASSLTAIGGRTVSGSATIAATAAVTALFENDRAGAATFSNTNAVAATYHRDQQATATITQGNTVTATGVAA